MIKRKLSFWSTDKIVACGLVVMGIIAVTGTIAHQIISGTATGSEVPMAIVSGLTGFLGRGALSNETTNKAQPTQEVEYEERDETSPDVIPAESKGEERDVKK
jgi:hypothetical protein